MPPSPRLLSGVQPSGQLHLGNYFGAIRQHIAGQDDAFYFIADYHALTTLQTPDVIARYTREVAATYLALGLDPQRATLFRQSDVPEVCELTWLLATVAGVGLLERAVSYKEKRERGIAASVGLFCYPVLMAADILAYDTDIVPVGSDQVQHLEMTRDIATSFNARFGETFKLPTFKLGVPEPVPGIDGAKMSKSYNNHIPLFSRGKALKKLVMGITTDSAPLEAAKDPTTCTVVKLYALVAEPAQVEEMAARYRAGGYGYGHAKLDLIAALDARFGAARAEYDRLLAEPDALDALLAVGAERARAVARQTLARARAAMGLPAQPAG